MQALIRIYKVETGAKEIDMHDVAAWAMKNHGLRGPTALTPVELLAKEFAKAAREELRHDQQTGHPYRVHHALPQFSPNGQVRMSWFDIDEAPPRKHMLKSLKQRRDQMIGDGLQLTFDADHWNNTNPLEAPIVIPLDFTDDVAERKLALAPEQKAG